jgi:Zn finger protein HypA/HybF involved in hydrogenase expression
MIGMDGRPVTFYVVDSVLACPDCNLDPITDTSTDSFCPTCSGEYWIPTYSGATMSGHVTWGKSESRAWETGGMLDNGDVTVKVMHTAEREEIIHSSQFVVVDDREMDIKNILLRGVPSVNRIIVALKEKERQ